MSRAHLQEDWLTGGGLEIHMQAISTARGSLAQPCALVQADLAQFESQAALLEETTLLRHLF